MRRAFLTLLFIFSFLSVSIKAPKTAYASVEDFKVKNFTVDYFLTQEANRSSSMLVKEKIVILFPEYDQNHGIKRALPKTYQNHTVSLKVNSITDQSGRSYEYASQSQNDNLVLKIGDPNSYAHGETVYNIEYSLKNVISFPDDRPQSNEFYWDVNGTEWPQTFDQITANLHISKSLAGQLTDQQVCYSGIQGSKAKNCTITRYKTGDEEIVRVTANNLNGYENISIVAGFKGDTFVLGPEVQAEKNKQFAVLIFKIFIGLITPVLTFIYCFSKWWKNGRDPKGKGVIIPEYVSPKNLNVLSSSYILNQSFDPKAASAGIIEMAIKGFLQINVTEKKKFIGKSTDFELEVIKVPFNLNKEQELILDALFDGSIKVGSKTNISNQKNKLFSTIQKVSDHLGKTLTVEGFFKSDPVKAKTSFITKGVFLVFIGGFTMTLLPIGLGLIISAFIAFIFALIMPSRTPLGVETRDYLLGLKEYIKMAETDRIAYLQSPKGAEKINIDPNDPKQKIKLFEDLLPYAMLFGLEKDWAEQFKDLYQQPPNWYNGNMSGFNAVYLANSVSGFSSANSAAFSAPSSSSSSGFGGGGGFSGGGGGGGGGGGW